MAEGLPIRKYVKVKLKKRKNRVRGTGQQSTSYALRWTEYGQRRSLSLGPHATSAYAERMRGEMESKLNSPSQHQALKPVQWKAFVEDYLNQTYPGYDLPSKERKEKARDWKKSLGTMKREHLAIRHFGRIVEPDWCHDITTRDRDRYVTERMKEAGSAATVDAELRAMHHLVEIMEEWGHRTKGENPFAGKAKVDERRRRRKGQDKGTKEKHYTFEEVKAVLALATKEAGEDPTFEKKRLRALVYFIAFTGCRFGEAAHLEWQDIDWDNGIAWLYFKVDNDLKTEGSQAPFGLPEKLMAVLREWELDKICSWVFSNSRKTPWKAGAPGYRPFDQIQALGERLGIEGANFKRFRHAMATHGKGRFGMTAEQVQAQLRHTTTDTQKHYTHDDLANLRDAVKKVDFEDQPVK
jgi:integrase